MEFREDLARVACDPAVRRLALRRAGSRELAEDALQETYYNVARTPHPEAIRDLRAFFCTCLVREINRQRMRLNIIPVEDIGLAAENGRESSIRAQPASVEDDAARRQLAETLIKRLDRDRGPLLDAIAARSADQCGYGTAIVATARAVLLLLLEGQVARDDWNAELRSAYTAWFAEPGLDRNNVDQRFSRARRDLRVLLTKIVSRNELNH